MPNPVNTASSSPLMRVRTVDFPRALGTLAPNRAPSSSTTSHATEPSLAARVSPTVQAVA